MSAVARAKQDRRLRPAVLFVREEGVEVKNFLPVQRLGDIEVGYYNEEQEKKHERNMVDALFDLDLYVPSDRAFDQEHQHQPAVQNGNGQKIDDRQVEADHCHDK